MDFIIKIPDLVGFAHKLSSDENKSQLFVVRIMIDILWILAKRTQGSADKTYALFLKILNNVSLSGQNGNFD
jgi:hypothetical protein